ncbi:hypothetical protein B0J11DRAFT_147132 [Dendryphion nanum]|uniref:Uncharacterized protein n=1 Tax=Dendryphion nanum TaxID=256645 RepID=A0A9P9D609_9PLEO|nr:hypothetical protein B0J11DRAFT_147132 [Dendryphion nanum]
MFHRRRAASNPAQKQPINPSALLAATKASMRSHDSNASLSSAAAAAALRTHPSAPIQVGNTVTKRMVRKGSTSSHGSGTAHPQHPGLRRHSSSGSMTERSFRAPSPNRGSPSFDHRDAPPVPAVPKAIPDSASVHRRASSLEPPYRGGSPVGRGGGRGVSLDRGVSSTAGRGQAQAHAARVTSLAQVPEDEVDGSPRSINFSRPISPPLHNPKPVTSTRGGHSGWHSGPYVNPDATFRGGVKPRPQTSEGLSEFAAHNAQQYVQNASEKHVSKKTFSHGVEGTRLSSGSMRARPSGANVVSYQQPSEPVDPNSNFAVYDPSTRTFIHKQNAMQRFRELSDQQGTPSSDYVYQPQSQEKARNVQQQHVPQSRELQPSPTPIRHETTRSPSPPTRHEESPEPRYEQPQSSAAEVAEYHEPAKAEAASTSTSYQDVPELARQTSEDLAGDDIRPSIDANISRKLEYTSTRPEQDLQNPISPKLASNLDSPYPQIPTPVNSTTTKSATEGGRGTPRSERTHSLSPPRNAHFSAVSIELPNGIRHQPPPRSVSPAKSALKASPSVSRRNSSPFTNVDRSHIKVAPSEASDNMSEDGTKMKKKKTVRVSFDEEAVVAGTSAYIEPEAPSSPTGLSQSRWSSATGEQDIDDVMRPRPALPSFGSIRGASRRADDSDAPEKVTETVSSSMSTSVGSIGEPLEASNDHAIGGILSRDFANKNSKQDPLPPEVTSVEGTGYVSDSSSSDSDLEKLISDHINRRKAATEQRKQSVPELEPKTLTTSSATKPRTIEVPVIAVQPASPSPRSEIPEPKFEPLSSGTQEKPSQSRSERASIPGGWDEDESDREVQNANTKPIGIYTTPISAANLQSLDPKTRDNDSSDDNSSIYSDAYEEFTDAEDGGFASIDAVVESPVISPSSGLMFSKHADQSLAEPARSPLSSESSKIGDSNQTVAATNDWHATRQHWSGVNESRKQQTSDDSPVQRTTPVKSTATPIAKIPQPTPYQSSTAPNPQTEGRPSTQKASQKPTEKPAQALKAYVPGSSVAPAQPRKSALKKTSPIVEESTKPEVHMRKSMRGNTAPAPTPASATHMRQSMRGNEKIAPRAQPGLAASRHSAPPPTKGALQKKHIPAVAASSPKARPQSAVIKPSAPVPTYDSDSDASASSFQRSRPRAKRGADSRYTMRASMRGSAAPTMREAPTMRAMSPVEKPYSPPPAALKKSMRPSSPTPEPTANKSSRFSIRSLSPAGRFRPAKSTPHDAPPVPSQTASPKRMSGMGGFGKQKAKPIGKSQPKSRFADSSDEDEDARPGRFQSRFADSDSDDDYELPPGLAPVRGIPRKTGDEDNDSTDLEEELSDPEPSPAKAKDIEKGGLSTTNGHTNGHTNGKSATFAAGSLRQSKHAPDLPTFESGKKVKRGFFGLGKKKTSPQPIETIPEPVTTTDDSNDIPHPPEHRNRPLTPIGEDKALEARSGSRSPKLQRRTMPQYNRSASDSWPIPLPPTIGDDDVRPQSSDGVTSRRTSLRPTLNKRHSSQVSETARIAIDPKTGKEVVIGRSGKKKKFQGLRRVFGLND